MSWTEEDWFASVILALILASVLSGALYFCWQDRQDNLDRRAACKQACAPKLAAIQPDFSCYCDLTKEAPR